MITPSLLAIADLEIPSCLRRRAAEAHETLPDYRPPDHRPFVADPRIRKRSEKRCADTVAREAVAQELRSFDSVTLRSIRAAHPAVDPRAVRRYLRELLRLRRVTREGNTYIQVNR